MRWDQLHICFLKQNLTKISKSVWKFFSRWFGFDASVAKRLNDANSWRLPINFLNCMLSWVAQVSWSLSQLNLGICPKTCLPAGHIAYKQNKKTFTVTFKQGQFMFDTTAINNCQSYHRISHSFLRLYLIEWKNGCLGWIKFGTHYI